MDTNILLRLLLQDDAAQLRMIERYLEKAKHSRLELQVHSLSLAETIWILERKAWSRSSIADALLELCSSTFFRVIDLDVIRAALETYLQTKVSFIDAFQAAYVTQQRLQSILSFDRDFDGLGVKRIEPK